MSEQKTENRGGWRGGGRPKGVNVFYTKQMVRLRLDEKDEIVRRAQSSGMTLSRWMTEQSLSEGNPVRLAEIQRGEFSFRQPFCTKAEDWDEIVRRAKDADMTPQRWIASKCLQ